MIFFCDFRLRYILRGNRRSDHESTKFIFLILIDARKQCWYAAHFLHFSRYLEPGSHMPPTYLGRPETPLRHVNIYRRIIIYPRHWPPSCPRNWTEFNFAGKRRLLAMKIFYVNSICRCNEWCNNSIFPTIPYLQIEWLKIAPIRFAFRANLSTSAIHRRCAEDPLEQIAERCQLQPVAGRSATFENQVLEMR